MKKVLWIMPYAPHYREGMLRRLAKRYELTVLAMPCALWGLIEPKERKGYTYLETKPIGVLNDRLKLRVSLEEFWEITGREWDVVICAEDMHFPLRYLSYVLNRARRATRWIWWGHFEGKRDLGLIRKLLVDTSDGAITYTETSKRKIEQSYGARNRNIVSSNNTEIAEEDIEWLPLTREKGKLNIIYIGRLLPHKRLERLIDLARRNRSVRVRIIGPDSDRLNEMIQGKEFLGEIEILGAITGAALKEHLSWSNIVGVPGHLGLLVTVAGRFRRGVFVDSGSRHAPEVEIAERADQPMIDWSDENTVDGFIERCEEDDGYLEEIADRLQNLVREQYTFEAMVERISRAIEAAAST